MARAARKRAPSPDEKVSTAASADPLDVIVLARVASTRGKGAIRVEVLARDLAPFSPTLGARWLERVESAVQRSVTRGHLDKETLRLTKAGVKALAQRLGRAPAKTWAKAVELLACAAVGTKPPKTKAARAVRAASIAQAHGLPDKSAASDEVLLHALAWHELFQEEPPARITLDGLVLRALRVHAGRSAKPTRESLLRRLGAIALDTPSTTPAGIHTAALRGWLREPPPLVERNEVSLDTFAARVLEVARAAPAASRFGPRKVFVDAVWQALADDDVVRGLDVDAFKARLLEAQRARLLHLHRADLVRPEHAESVRRSEIRDLNATFHVVEVEGARP
jgi:hypothetical protein